MWFHRVKVKLAAQFKLQNPVESLSFNYPNGKRGWSQRERDGATTLLGPYCCILSLQPATWTRSMVSSPPNKVPFCTVVIEKVWSAANQDFHCTVRNPTATPVSLSCKFAPAGKLCNFKVITDIILPLWAEDKLRNIRVGCTRGKSNMHNAQCGRSRCTFRSGLRLASIMVSEEPERYCRLCGWLVPHIGILFALISYA